MAEDLWSKLKKTDKPVVLYGTGDGAEKIAARLAERGIAAAGVFASDGFVRPGKKFMGMPVTSYEQAKARFGDMCVLVCFGSDRPEVIAIIRRIALEQELFMPDVPVCGGGTFDSEYYEAHRAELDAVRSKLADDASRRCFDEVIEYKLSGRIDHLFAGVSPAEEAWSLMEPSSSDVYVDLGAYTGDTLAEFRRAAGGWRAAFAFEPDARNYRKLREKAEAEGWDDCTLLNAAAGAAAGTAEFVRNAGRGSSARGGKTVTVPVEAVDEVLRRAGLLTAAGGGIKTADAPALVIKMDVEGAEAAAVCGAAEAVRSLRPRMMIAAYHRNEDLFAVPQQVLSLISDCGIYLRRSLCLPAWELNYIFVPR